MQLDKDTLNKHRFWIGLGAFGLFWIVALIALVVSVGDTSAKARETYEAKLKQVKGLNDAKNSTFTAYLKQKESRLEKHKSIVWKKMWEQQADLMTWFFRDDVRTPNLRKVAATGKFGDEISLDDRISYRDHLYSHQFDGKAYEALIYPATFQGSWDKIITPVKWGDKTPTSEEIWLAQEDFWVKRDLLYAIRAALDSVAVMKPVPAEKGAKPAEGTLPHQRFRNTNWELDLVLEQSGKELYISPKTTIKNINPHRRTLSPRDVQVAVWPSGKPQRARTLSVEGEMVGWGASTQVVHNRIRIDQYGFQPTDKLEASQVFTLRTSPIKQVNDIRLGYHSSRTDRQALVAKQMADSPKEEPGDAAPAPASPPPGGAGAGGGVGMMGGNPGGAGMVGQSPGGPGGNSPPRLPTAGAGDQTPIGLERKRYVQVTPQVRRMPIGLVLVLDQAYIPDVLTALANSRLRIQPTQVHWKHETRGVQSSGTSPFAGVPPGGMIGVPPGGGKIGVPPGGMIGVPPGAGDGMGGEGGMRMPPLMPGQRFGGMPYGPGYMPPVFRPGGFEQGIPGGSSFGSDDDDPNLVELSFYGILSLYERYQPPAQTDAGTGTPQPGTPPPGGNQQPPPGGNQQPPMGGDMGKQPPPGGDMGKDAGKQAPKGGDTGKDAAKDRPPADDKGKKDGTPKP